MSSELGTLNFIKSHISSEENLIDIENRTILEKYGIEELTIILDLEDVLLNQDFLIGQSNMINLRLMDTTVPMINSILFTFYRSRLYIFEHVTKELWLYNQGNYQNRNTNLRYDYWNNDIIMVVYELVRRVFVFFKLLLAFALMSCINALIIRLIIKTSSILVHPLIFIKERCRRANENEGYPNRAVYYQSLSQNGAMAAYLDRNESSKCNLILSIALGMTVYYTMWVGSHHLWTVMTFGETFSGMINDRYFFYIAYTELFVFVFCRTRSSIKYLPKYITVLNMIYLFYVNMYIYPAVYEASIVLNYCTLFFFAWFIRRYEL